MRASVQAVSPLSVAAPLPAPGLRRAVDLFSLLAEIFVNRRYRPDCWFRFPLDPLAPARNPNPADLFSLMIEGGYLRRSPRLSPV